MAGSKKKDGKGSGKKKSKKGGGKKGKEKGEALQATLGALVMLKSAYTQACKKMLTRPLPAVENILNDCTANSVPITRLAIMSTPLSINDVFALTQSFETYSALTSIYISHSGLSIRGLEVLCEFAQKRVKEIHLTHSSLHDKFLAPLISLCKNTTSLETLVLDHNPIDGDDFSRLAREVKAPLQKLSVKYCTLTPNGIESIVSFIESNTSVNEFDLSGNDIGNEGMKAIASALAKNSTLKCLRLLSVGLCEAQILSNDKKTNVTKQSEERKKNSGEEIPLLESTKSIARIENLPAIKLPVDTPPKATPFVVMQAFKDAILRPISILNVLDLRGNSIGYDAAEVVLEILKGRKEMRKAVEASGRNTAASPKSTQIHTQDQETVSSATKKGINIAVDVNQVPAISNLEVTQSTVLQRTPDSFNLCIWVTERLKHEKYIAIWDMNHAMGALGLGDNVGGKGGRVAKTKGKTKKKGKSK